MSGEGYEEAWKKTEEREERSEIWNGGSGKSAVGSLMIYTTMDDLYDHGRIGMFPEETQKRRKERKGKDDEFKGGKLGDGKDISSYVQPQTLSA